MNILIPSLENCVFVPPSLATWFYALSVHGACCLAGGVSFGSFLYYVSANKTGDRESNPETIARNNNLTRPIFGVFVGILASASVYILRADIEGYAPNNESGFIGLLFASTFGFTSFFKSMNAAFGTYPEGADKDIQTWLMWFVMTPEPTFTKGKSSKASRREMMATLRGLLFKIIALYFLLTVLIQHPPHYQIIRENSSVSFSQEDIENGGDSKVFHWILSFHVNGFFHVWLLYLFFSFSLDCSTVTNYVISGGVRMESGFSNPLLESRSFKETWGTRWNRPVNALLKRTVYIPARKSGYFDQKLSALLTFFASGLLHEYNFTIHNHRSLSLSSGYRHGEVTVFFLLMGILTILESWVWKRCFPKSLKTAIEHLPSAVIASMLTLMVAGPAECYFLQAWIQSGFIEGLAKFLPHMNCQ